jgi:prepilin-type processing-associated H-X9-DG protein
MNTRAWHLRKRDVVVLILCAASLISTLGAVGEGGRKRAKEMVCQSNLHQWGGIFQGYIDQNGGTFVSGPNLSPNWWVRNLKEEDKDWKRMRIWFCPTATTPTNDEKGKMASTLTSFNAWGIYQGTGFGPNGICGSYGLNGYVIPILDGTRYEGGRPASDGWRDIRSVADADRVPMFTDALRFDLWPLYIDTPPELESLPWSSFNHMRRCCINRHNGAVSCLFVDGSVRKVGLKELWTLKWHKSFNTAGPWTTAGGVWSSDWPAWMRDFRDY